MYEGTVNSVSVDRGFGFIRTPNYPEGVFFHARETDASLPFDETLRERRVRFEVVDGPKGPRAVVVRAAY